MTERDICAGIRAGKPEASEALAKALKNHCERFFVTFGKEMAEDLLQELNARVLEAIQQHRVRDTNFPIAYARGIARILCSDALEARNAMRNVIPFPLHLSTPATGESDLLRSELEAERDAIIDGLIDKLPEMNRKIIRLTRLGRTAEQIRKTLGLTAKQFEHRKSRSIQALMLGVLRAIQISPSGSNHGPLALAA
jgi:RNA polymerase sigma factor (sigma-70 family)